MIKKLVQRSKWFHLVLAWMAMLLCIMLILVLLRQPYAQWVKAYEEWSYREAVEHFTKQENRCWSQRCRRVLYNKWNALVRAWEQIIAGQSSPYDQQTLNQVKAYRNEALESYTNAWSTVKTDTHRTMITHNRQIVEQLLAMLEDQPTNENPDQDPNQDSNQYPNQDWAQDDSNQDSSTSDESSTQNRSDQEGAQETEWDQWGQSDPWSQSEQDEQSEQSGQWAEWAQWQQWAPLSDEIMQQLNTYQKRLQSDQQVYQNAFNPVWTLEESGLSQNLPDQSWEKDW